MKRAVKSQRSKVTDQTVTFGEMTEIVFQCHKDLKDNKIMRDLVTWYLIGAEKAKTRTLTDEDWVEWIVRGRSNAYGNSFGEVHGSDPMIILASLPPMEKHRNYLLSKYQSLSSCHKFRILDHFWKSAIKRDKK